jgi:cytochrome c biogenesis protein
MTDTRTPETAAAQEEPKAPRQLPTWRWAWRQLTSMRTALVLLFLLALASVPGSLLPQDGTDPASVQQYFTSHPTLAPWLDRIGLFNVFASPWFAAIYILLFVSLVGCVLPRTFKLVGESRTPPPKAPRFLTRLPHSASYSSPLPPAEAASAAAAVLGGHRYRLRRPATDDPGFWVAAEKGYLREAGNLLFHLALLGVLISVALGGIFGYKGDKLLVEGQTFADTQSALDEFHPGRLATGSNLAPFDLTLNKFTANYITSGQNEGQPSSFRANVTYSASPGAPKKRYDLQVNHPLAVDSVKVYLIGHGFAPVFTVRDSHGKVVYDQATPFIPANTSSMLSDGVVKAANASPVQLGFMGVFVPTVVAPGGTLQSAFPAPDNPAVSLIGYAGNLGLNSGQPESVYQLDTTAMSKISGSPRLLFPGQTWKLADGQGSITFSGYKQWVSLQTTYDPGQIPALVCGMLAIAGLLLSFLIRRRRMFVRAVASDPGSGSPGGRSGPAGRGSTVTVGGLARTDAAGGFEEEFAELAEELSGSASDINQSETKA